ncbi:MAG: hypothetical protein V1744_03235 [Candidatus Altiarchaeota archaeon]
MARRSAAAHARHAKKRQEFEAELSKYQTLARELRNSSESTLVKTHKQREYHKKILEIQSQMEKLGK